MNTIVPFRKWFRPLLQTGVSFFAFVLANRLGSLFMIGDGVSVFYPATAVDVVCIMHFGIWGVIGIFLGALATPWETDLSFFATVVSGTLNVIEGVIPWLWFRFNRTLHRELIDLRSLFHFIVFGAVLNSALSALVGNLYLIEPIGTVKGWAWLTWWISDFSASVLVAMPVLAFGGWIFDRIAGRDPHDVRRTLGNAVQITLAIIIIGWSASTVVQHFLADMVEGDRLRQNEQREQMSALLSELDRALIEASIAEDQSARADATRRVQSALERLPAVISRASLGSDQLAELARVSQEDLGDGRSLPRYLLSASRLRAILENEQNSMWNDFAGRREKTHLVSVLMDQMVLVILLFATVYLLVRVARPLEQINEQVHRLRRGEIVDTGAIHSPFLEVRNLADTLSETSSSLARKSKDLVEQTNRALAASKAKSEFLAKMSHELRTPLNSIIGFSDLLLERGDSMTTARNREFLRHISGSGRRLLELINDLLDLAKIESGKMKLVETRVDLRDPVRSACRMVSPLVTKRSQVLRVDLSDAVELTCDPKRIEQVVLNLLSNATKFSPEGSPIDVRVKLAGGYGIVEVEDRGSGISAESQERVFHEFEQAHEEWTEGTGLGLALVQRIVELHGGWVELESTPGAGSVFRLAIPVDRPGGREGGGGMFLD
ncbi:MAG: MASE1 domain-containing protein [Acidobacteria bacterium]|nr:MASE1 domain-containing protein [Acidobacteriota bacterium]